MPALTDIALPESLASQLTEDARRQLADTPLDKRVERFAVALSLTESIAMAKLAAGTGLGLLEEPVVDPDVLRVLPARFAKECQLLPVQPPPDSKAEAGTLHLATVWPPSAEITDWLATFSSRPLRWYLAPAERLRQLITDHYGVGSDSLEESAEQQAEAAPAATLETDADADAVVVRFVTEVIAQAVEVGATDIHFEPQEGQLRIRYRVDGLLVPVPLPDNLLRFQDAVISRLKIMARLNISERRLPQDGRIDFRAGGAAVDIRVSTIPTIYA